MIETFVRRPATTIIFVLFFALLGFVSYFNLNVEQSPRIEFPLVVVNAIYPGASPLEMESQIIKKMEDAVVEIAEIKKMESRAFESAGYILIEFNLSADINAKTAEVKDKVEGILNNLPRGMERPIVQRVDPFAVSVVDLVLTSKTHSPKELFEYADKKLRNQFTKVSGVGSVDLFGGEERQIKVALSPSLLQQKYLGISDVVTAVRNHNVTIPGGNIDRDDASLAVRFVGEFDRVEDIAAMPITTSDGSRFPLSSIARVYDGSKKIERVARYNQGNVVSLAVKKVSDGNEVNVARGILRMVPELQQSLPEGMQLEVALDRSATIVNETRGTIQSILLGIFLTILVLYFFTGNPRITVIAAVVIPSSLVSAFLLMDFSGFTINFITLLAMATSLGTLIANAIVIVEAVLKRLEKGEDSIQAAVQGTKDVVVPVLAACGTNLVVFTPIAFMGGIIGQFMLQFGMTVVFATLFSLMASFSLTPMMCALLLRPKKADEKPALVSRISDTLVNWALKEYRYLFDFLFRFPKTTLAMGIAVFAGALMLLPYIGSEFSSISDADRIEVKLTLPQGSTVAKSLRFVEEVENEMRNYPEILSTLSIVGQNGQENASIVAKLKPAAERSRSDNDLIQLMTPFLATLPGVEVELRRGNGGGGGMGGDITINVLGPDYDEMIRLSEKVMEKMKETGSFRSIVSSYKEPKMEVRFLPDPAKLIRYGITNAQIGQAIRASIYGDNTNVLREAGEEYEISIELDDLYKTSAESLAEIALVARLGLIPITELGELRFERATPTLQRRDRQRVIQISGYLSKSTAGVVQAELVPRLESIGFPAGFEYRFAGNAEFQAETNQEMGKAFGLAILLTYMILAAILNSFVHPFTISSSILTSFAGVFLLLFFTESPINIASMLGMIMLVGLAVNNAILILDEAGEQLKDGTRSIQEALWLGIHNKFRAVLMTSIAVVAGALPQMWAPEMNKAAMGAVIVGGMAASIFFTFVMIPQVYWYVERLRRWTGRLGSRR